MSASLRLGLFHCRSPHPQEPQPDFDRLKALGADYDQVKVVQQLDPIWSPECWSRLREMWQDQNLDGVVLAAEQLAGVPPTLPRLWTTAGLDPEAIEVVFWRGPGGTLDPDIAVRHAIERLLTRDRLQMEEVPLSRKVLVLGHGWTALKAAAELADLGLEVMLVSSRPEVGDTREASGYTADNAAALDQLAAQVKGHNAIDLCLGSRVVDFEGAAGEYKVTVADDSGAPQEYLVGGVVLALEPELEMDLAAWGLEPGAQVMSLADLESCLGRGELPASLGEAQGEEENPVIFLLGFTHASEPVLQARAYQAALRLVREHQLPVMVLLEHLKVADQGLEALSLKAREAGVVFVKLTGRNPRVESGGDGLSVSFYDEVMGRELQVRPRLLVIEETVRPAREAQELADLLEIFPDPRGFFQGDHIYNLPIFTNRTGILAVGPARGPLSLAENFAEAREAALYLFELLSPGRAKAALDRVRLDRKKCAICLTCYRLCPHRAISVVNRRPQFSDLACQVCGICASECPMDALQIHNFSDRRVQTEVRFLTAAPAARAETPVILVFACRNSAAQAARLAGARKLPLPVGLTLLEVPCAGKVDPDYIMTAFKEGADGVMVLACHPESCKSVQGSPRARERVEMLKEFLAETGLEAERLVYAGLAPGMGQEFARLTLKMAVTLAELGKNPLGRVMKESA